MRPSTLAILAAALLLSGCSEPATPTEPAPAPDVQPGAPQPQRAEFPAFNLSTRGSYQAAGTYIHPGVSSIHDPQTYNCLLFDTKGSYVARIDASAEWPDGGNLVLYHQLKDPNAPFRDEGHAIGPSPLAHAPDVSGFKPSALVWVGVEPAPDLPVSAGLKDGIALRVTLEYTGPVAPTLRGPGYCSHDTA